MRREGEGEKMRERKRRRRKKEREGEGERDGERESYFNRDQKALARESDSASNRLLLR